MQPSANLTEPLRHASLPLMPVPFSTPMVLLTTAILAGLLAALVVLLCRRRAERARLELHLRLLETLSDAVFVADAAGTIVQHNAAATRLCGGDAVGSPLADWLPQAQHRERQFTVLRRRDGSEHAVEVTHLASRTGGESLLLVRASVAAQSDDAERFMRSQYFARIGTWDWHIDTEELYWSDAIYGMFGYQVGEVTPSYQRFCEHVHPDDQARVRAGELRCIATGQNHDEEYRVVWADGTVRWLRETGNVVTDAQGAPLRMMGIVRDITEEKAWASELSQRAHHDPLTGLPNRLLFEDRLAAAIERARRHDQRLMLAFIDLDGFKAINDQHGHAAGDSLLVSVGSRLQDALRLTDTVARIGGDEFVVILEELSPRANLADEAQRLADKLLAALAPPMVIDGMAHVIGASLGIAVYPDHAQSMDKLIHVADLAMYAAKRGGSNRHCLGDSLVQLSPG